MLWKFAMLALMLLVAVNWFILPTFPFLLNYVKPMNLWAAAGLSAIFMVVGLVKGK